jgi:hypothetical protein
MFFDTLRRIRSIATKHSGKSFTPEGLTHLIRMQFHDPILKFHTHRSPDIPTNDWWINGTYDIVDDQDDLPCVHINLMFSTKKRKLQIDKLDWNQWAFHVADVMTHEYLHRYYVHNRGMRFGRGYQTRHMGEYERNMKDYLGCEDEILAYGFSCAAEMLCYQIPFEQTKTHKLYKKYFFKTDPKVVLKLKRQAIKYIKHLERLNNDQIRNSGCRSRI